MNLCGHLPPRKAICSKYLTYYTTGLDKRVVSSQLSRGYSFTFGSVAQTETNQARSSKKKIYHQVHQENVTLKETSFLLVASGIRHPPSLYELKI